MTKLQKSLLGAYTVIDNNIACLFFLDICICIYLQITFETFYRFLRNIQVLYMYTYIIIKNKQNS